MTPSKKAHHTYTSLLTHYLFNRQTIPGTPFYLARLVFILLYHPSVNR